MLEGLSEVSMSDLPTLQMRKVEAQGQDSLEISELVRTAATSRSALLCSFSVPLSQ